MCENLVNALKLSANQQLGCDSLVQGLVAGHEEGRRLKMTRELVDGHEAITIGDLEATFVSLSIVEPEFNKEDFPQARLRGTVELTPRKGEVVGGAQSSWTRTGTPSAKPSSGKIVLQVCCKAVNIRKPGNNSKAMALWMLKDAKTIGEVHHDWSRERHIVSRATVRQAL